MRTPKRIRQIKELMIPGRKAVLIFRETRQQDGESTGFSISWDPDGLDWEEMREALAVALPAVGRNRP